MVSVHDHTPANSPLLGTPQGGLTAASRAVEDDHEISALPTQELIARIEELRRKRRALILAHNYQIPEIQDLVWKAYAGAFADGGFGPVRLGVGKALGQQQSIGWRENQITVEELVGEELYDLTRDPGESRNLALEAPPALDDFRRGLSAYLEASRVYRAFEHGDAIIEDDALRERLEALGYITSP